MIHPAAPAKVRNEMRRISGLYFTRFITDAGDDAETKEIRFIPCA
jgi:hypothetical protein